MLTHIDSSGVRGICSLLVLQALMDKIKAAEEEENVQCKGKSGDERLPEDYFDLAGGTSTGGLVDISHDCCKC
jgi:patatin-like phospholipase/acyl hydrolase